MTSEEGENYCEFIAMNAVKIKNKVDDLRYKAALEASRTFDYNDPTANKVVNEGSEIDSIELIIDDIKINIDWPERWIKIVNLVIKRYSQRYGEQAAATIITRYLKGKEPTQVYVSQGISRRSFGRRREKFLPMLLLYAVQNKLLTVS